METMAAAMVVAMAEDLAAIIIVAVRKATTDIKKIVEFGLEYSRFTLSLIYPSNLFFVDGSLFCSFWIFTVRDVHENFVSNRLTDITNVITFTFAL